jgi:hypothetical protein
MKNLLAPLLAIAAILVLAGGGALALTGGGDDEDSTPQSAAAEERCAADAAECEAPPGGDQATDGDDALGICVEGTVDCDDTITDPNTPVSNDGGVANACLEGAPDCNDTPADQPLTDPGVSEPNTGSGNGSSGSPGPDEIVAKVSGDLSSRTGAEVVLVSLEAVDWPDTSLGNPQAEMFYAQVITPGYKIVLASGGANYEYHTDLNGNWTLLD